MCWAFSAPEPRAVATYLSGLINKAGRKVVSFIDFHAYSQLWMYPYGYSCTKQPAHLKQFQESSQRAISALRSVHGTQYKQGGICRIIYPANGGSIDYTYDRLDIVYSVAVELRDRGRYGFMLPANQILPTGQETFAALKQLNQYIAENL